MKQLETLLEAYRDNLITLSQLEKESKDILFMDENEKEIIQNRIRNKIIQDFSNDRRVETPEEIVCNEETANELLRFFGWLKEVIGDKDWWLLNEYVVDSKTFQTIGYELGISKQAVCSRFQTIKKKINSFLEYYEGDIELVKDSLIAKPFGKNSGSPTHLGYPHEFLRRVSLDGHWGKSRRTGHKVFISRNKCLIPSYLEAAFNGEQVHCTICNGGKGCQYSNRKKSF